MFALPTTAMRGRFAIIRQLQRTASLFSAVEDVNRALELTRATLSNGFRPEFACVRSPAVWKHVHDSESLFATTTTAVAFRALEGAVGEKFSSEAHQDGSFLDQK